jgi:hypothetical protein
VIHKNTFKENFSGLKGTALYLKGISNTEISSSTFTLNRPVYKKDELDYSPYVKYFSSRGITFHDKKSICSDEFEYLVSCVSSLYKIAFPHVKGALYVEYC